MTVESILPGTRPTICINISATHYCLPEGQEIRMNPNMTHSQSRALLGKSPSPNI